MRYGLYEFLVM
jgi:hypothetical protein